MTDHTHIIISDEHNTMHRVKVDFVPDDGCFSARMEVVFSWDGEKNISFTADDLRRVFKKLKQQQKAYE